MSFFNSIQITGNWLAFCCETYLHKYHFVEASTAFKGFPGFVFGFVLFIGWHCNL